MKINKFLTAALAATTLLASCSKEAGNTNSTNGEDRTVQIQIDYAGSETRATGDQIADNTAVAFSGGYLLFTNTGDAVTFVVAIETGSTAYTEAGKKVGITELKAGTQITAVPGNSTKVYFIGNKPSAMAAPAVGDIVSNYTATVASQHSAGTVANVSLFGGKALTPVSAGAADEYEATFDVKPIAARYEIMEITGAHSGGGANTFEYQIDGIFIDKYYDDMKLAGTAGTLKSNGNDPAKYVPNATGSSYVTANAGAVYDYNATVGIANNTSFSPASGVWNYNLLAPTSAGMPAIIIKVSNVKVNGTVWNEGDPYFLTIDSFFTTKGGNTALTVLAQGNIYVLDDIEFDENDLGEKPYTTTKKVQVKVTMLPWESSNIGWDL